MPGTPKDVADATIQTTPRTLIIIVSSVLAIYASIFATFVTTGQFDTLSEQFYLHAEAEAEPHSGITERLAQNERQLAATQEILADHVAENTVWRIETLREQNADKLKATLQRQAEPGGDTPAVRDWIREYQKRDRRYEQQVNCIHSGGSHCLVKPG